MRVEKDEEGGKEDKNNGVALEEALLRHFPRVGYLSLCSPTQELHQKVNVTVKKRDTRLANMRNADTGNESLWEAI